MGLDVADTSIVVLELPRCDKIGVLIARQIEVIVAGVLAVRRGPRCRTRNFSRIHHLQLADVTTEKITKVTDKLADTPGTALHAVWTARTFLRWCVKRRFIDLAPSVCPSLLSANRRRFLPRLMT